MRNVVLLQLMYGQWVGHINESEYIGKQWTGVQTWPNIKI